MVSYQWSKGENKALKEKNMFLIGMLPVHSVIGFIVALHFFFYELGPENKWLEELCWSPLWGWGVLGG